MKHFIFLLFLFLSFECGCFAEEQKPSTDSKELHGVAFKDRASGARPMHAPVSADIILLISENQCIVLFNNSHGTGLYLFSDITSNITISGNVDTSVVSCLSIPIQLSDSSVIDFYIEFEDGSWCNVHF